MDFNTVPGMTTWPDMPMSYKNAYYEHERRIKRRRKESIKEREEKRKEEEKRLKELEDLKRNFPSHSAKEKLNAKTIQRTSLVKSVEEDRHSNNIDMGFFNEFNKDIKVDENLKNILLVCDVKGWAWWNKSQYLKHYLSDEFNIFIDYVIGPGSNSLIYKEFDLYFTFGYSYIDYFKKINNIKKMTGVTAHRPLRVIRGSMMKTEHVHANSMLLYKELISFHNNVHYVPNGVDENLFVPKSPINFEGDFVVGHVGKKCDQKGQCNIIIPAMEKSGTKSITHLNDYRNKKPYCKMYELYNNMDVFIVASDEDGTPNPALEAAACGRPIISNKIGNMPEFIIDGYNGFIVEKNIDAYVDKLEWCKNNRDKVAEMGINARKTIEEGWTWKLQAENYREMFRKVLK